MDDAALHCRSSGASAPSGYGQLSSFRSHCNTYLYLLRESEANEAAKVAD
jgi:hypothetical protein